MTDEERVHGWLEASGALTRGHFLLSSGRHSPAYVQCALLLEEPARARWLGRRLAERLAEARPDSVLSPALGGLVIGLAVASALDVPFRFTERQGETMTLRRGFRLRPDERVVIVEDVVTTGRSTLETAAVARASGARATAVAAIIDRTGGSRDLGAPLIALVPLDLPSWEARDCPLCADGDRPVKPGSRPGAGPPLRPGS